MLIHYIISCKIFAKKNITVLKNIQDMIISLKVSKWSGEVSIVKKVLCLIGTVASVSCFGEPDQKSEEVPSVSTEMDSESSQEEVWGAPNYKEIAPEKYQDRINCDTARTLSEWKRWWAYLRFKKPVKMDWINGLRLIIYPKNEVFRALFVRGIYDPNLVAIINVMLPKDGVFFDVGANAGYCSLLASTQLGMNGKIFAFEPCERDFFRLIANVNLNKADNVRVYKLALSDKEGEATLSIAPEERSALNTFGTSFSDPGLEKVGVEQVQAMTLDAFVEQNHVDRIDLIKMDIEGSEYQALKGAVNSLRKFHPTVILGVNRVTLEACGTNIEDIERILTDLRYKSYRLVCDPDFGLEEVKDFRELKSGFIVCIPDGFEVPTLPKIKEVSLIDSICDFFVR